MDAELKSLDDKINQLVSLCQRLRRDNSTLRQQLATTRDENKRLSEKIGAARTRLESLLEQVPENSE
jgi:cell division protein ZapB